jgi:hypothetical protein
MSHALAAVTPNATSELPSTGHPVRPETGLLILAEVDFKRGDTNIADSAPSLGLSFLEAVLIMLLLWVPVRARA